MLLRFAILIVVALFFSATIAETPEMYVKRILKDLKKEDKTRTTMVSTMVNVLDPRSKKENTDVVVYRSKEESKTIYTLEKILKNESGMVETTQSEFHFFGDTLVFITVFQKLENTFVKNDPFLTERRVFVKDNKTISTTFKQGLEKNYKREKFYPQNPGSKSWNEAETLCTMALTLQKQVQITPAF